MAQGFKYNTKTWQQLSFEHKILVSDFQDTDVLRADVIKAFNNYYSGNGDYMRTFLLTMIWGFGDTGYGAFRTNRIINSDKNLHLIKQGIDQVKEDKLELAFHSLMKINGLGISYATKVLYFASKAVNKQEYALIFDNRVAKSLLRLCANNEIASMLNVSPSTRFEDYYQYICLIHQLSKQHGVDADAIELFLFEQNFT